jgi:ParB-like chromosome segregation protein Spo0J
LASEPLHSKRVTHEEKPSGNVDPQIHRVPVDLLVSGDSPRSIGISNAHVTRLAACGSSLPALVVHRKTMRVIDGMHRLQAAIRNGHPSVEVNYFDGDDNKAFILAVELNVKHGLPLPLSDRKTAVRRILATTPDLSDRAIASMAGLSDKTVAAIRARTRAEDPHLNSRRGRDGRVYPVGRSEGRRRVLHLICERPEASLREIASSAGVSPTTVRKVRKSLPATEDLAADEDSGSGKAVSGSRAYPGAEKKRQPMSAASRRRPQDSTQCAETQAGNWREILEKLRLDPSVWGKQAGRELLRWLAGHAIGVDDLPDCQNALPAHRVSEVVTMARQSANAWDEFARMLELNTGHDVC